MTEIILIVIFTKKLNILNYPFVIKYFIIKNEIYELWYFFYCAVELIPDKPEAVCSTTKSPSELVQCAHSCDDTEVNSQFF